VAAVLLNFTAVAPVKLVPVIVTPVPDCPVVGVKLEIVGAGCVTVKFEDEVAVPPGVVTEIVPVVAAAGTVVVIWVALATVKGAAIPLKATAVAPVKFVPVMVTAAPARPLVGVKLVTVGAGGITVKLLPDVPVPPEVVTEILPVAAPPGTVVVICVSLATVKLAVVPLNFSTVAPVRFVPVTVTLAPASPLVGVKLAIAGAAGGGGADMLPPPHARKATKRIRTGSSFRLVLNGLATESEAISAAIFGYWGGRSKKRELLYLWRRTWSGRSVVCARTNIRSQAELDTCTGEDARASISTLVSELQFLSVFPVLRVY
jgi:hypothetical protein